MKIEFYIRNGVKSAWVVDPAARRVDVYAPSRTVRSFREGDTLAEELLPGFALPLADLFALPGSAS